MPRPLSCPSKELSVKNHDVKRDPYTTNPVPKPRCLRYTNQRYL